jgi:hypothetical protein
MLLKRLCRAVDSTAVRLDLNSSEVDRNLGGCAPIAIAITARVFRLPRHYRLRDHRLPGVVREHLRPDDDSSVDLPRDLFRDMNALLAKVKQSISERLHGFVATVYERAATWVLKQRGVATLDTAVQRDGVHDSVAVLCGGEHFMEPYVRVGIDWKKSRVFLDDSLHLLRGLFGRESRVGRRSVLHWGEQIGVSQHAEHVDDQFTQRRIGEREVADVADASAVPGHLPNVRPTVDAAA